MLRGEPDGRARSRPAGWGRGAPRPTPGTPRRAGRRSTPAADPARRRRRSRPASSAATPTPGTDVRPAARQPEQPRQVRRRRGPPSRCTRRTRTRRRARSGRPRRGARASAGCRRPAPDTVAGAVERQDAVDVDQQQRAGPGTGPGRVGSERLLSVRGRSRQRDARMRTLRRNAGQTAAEYLGALLVVSVIVAAIATSDVGISVAREVLAARLRDRRRRRTASARRREAVRPQVRDVREPARRPARVRRRRRQRRPRRAGPRQRRRPDRRPRGRRRPRQLRAHLRLLHGQLRPRLLRRQRLAADRDDRLARPGHPDEPFRNAYWDPRPASRWSSATATPRRWTSPPTRSRTRSPNDELGLAYEGESRRAERVDLGHLRPPTSTRTTGRSARTCPSGAIRDMADPGALRRSRATSTTTLDTDARPRRRPHQQRRSRTRPT